MSEIYFHLSLIYWYLASSYFNLEKYGNAIEYFSKIDYQSLLGHKFTGIGMCYHKLGLDMQAEEKYINALKKNIRITEAYYNLAVLKLEQNKPEQAKKLLSASLNIDVNFKEAKKLLKSLKEDNNSDWFSWWFKNGWPKKVLGSFLLFLIFTITIFGGFVILGNLILAVNYITQEEIIGMGLTIGILFLLLILPSIKKMKFKDFEIDITVPHFQINQYDIILPKTIEYQVSNTTDKLPDTTF